MKRIVSFAEKSRISITALTAFLWFLAAPQTAAGQMTWKCATSKAEFQARYQHQGLAFDNKLWVLPGILFGKYDCPSIWSSTNGVNWTCALKNAPFPMRGDYASVVFDGYMWVIAGAPYC